jgi:hypothetical protein
MSHKAIIIDMNHVLLGTIDDFSQSWQVCDCLIAKKEE